MRIPRIIALIVLALSLSAGAQSQAPASAAPPALPMAEISADQGPCTVEFHVTDLDGKPLYDAKVTTTVRWGWGHKLELEAGTNAGGRVRFVKLPTEVKKPLQFEVKYQDQTAAYSIDPGTECHTQRDVPLKISVAADTK
jgi:hypothetical protein